MPDNHVDLTDRSAIPHWSRRNPFRRHSIPAPEAPPGGPLPPVPSSSRYQETSRSPTPGFDDDEDWDKALHTPAQPAEPRIEGSRTIRGDASSRVAEEEDDDEDTLGDYADEYSRRLSGIPFSGDPTDVTGPPYALEGGGSFVMQHNDESGDTLVHSPGQAQRHHSEAEDALSRQPGRTDSWIPFSPEFQRLGSGQLESESAGPPGFRSPFTRSVPMAHRRSDDHGASDESPGWGGLTRRFRHRDPFGGDSLDEEDEHYDKLEKASPLRSGGPGAGIFSGRPAKDPAGYSTALNPMNRSNSSSVDTLNSDGPMMDPDDPRVTGKEPNHLEEQRLETEMLRRMDYRDRRKHIQRMRIEFNVVSMAIRQGFVLKLARALMTFGAPSHRIESQLTAAARILEVRAEFIHLPGVIICSFGEQESGTSETHFVKTPGRLSLGSLHEVHLVYRSVVHDEVSAGIAAGQLDELMLQPPIYSTLMRCFFAFWLSVLICPLAFGGSFVDMWFSGIAAFILAFLQLNVAKKSALYANVFEITISIFISFAARGLSAIKSQIFCYTAISSSAIIGILPGYLILSSSLELASKNIVNGSVKMVYALIYTLFLGFGLQIGSDFFLLLDPQYRHQLQSIKDNLASSISFVGTWTADNDTNTNDHQVPLVGTFTFSHTTTPDQLDIIVGCYRPARFPWYLQPFPLWTSFIIVPVFSIISSLANLQPLKTKELPVMVLISCCSYAANKVANHYIFNRSDVVSAIGAFTVGLLGNMYSRKMGGTAFTSMVTGVLFLVPSGLSSAGGITANGSGIDIGGAMIAVTIGITVGLFMSQSLVYTFGSRKSAAVFSF